MPRGSTLARLDIFKRVPKDLTEPTFCGALLTSICFFVLVGLSLSEVARYLNVETKLKFLNMCHKKKSKIITAKFKTDMLVDISHSDDKLEINIDITFPRFPCEILSLDVQDVMGTHHVNIEGGLVKQRITANGEVILEYSAHTKQQDRTHVAVQTRDEVLVFLEIYIVVSFVMAYLFMKVKAQEGCHLYGNILINRVPGNFHISTHAFNDILMGLMQEGHHFDFSYKIDHISFGKRHNFDLIRSKFRDHQLISPLDGKQETAPRDNYYLKLYRKQYWGQSQPNSYQIFQHSF